MPERKDEAFPTKIIKIRAPVLVLDRCKEALGLGAHTRSAESTFLGYLLTLGINVYERGILPLERGEGDAASLAQSKEEYTFRKEDIEAAIPVSDEPLYFDEEKTDTALLTHEPKSAYGTEIEIQHPQGFDNNVTSIDYNIVYIPFYGRAAAGKPIDINIPPGRVVPYPAKLIKGEQSTYFVVQVEGTSMTNAGIQNDDYVIVRHAEEPKHGKIMLIRHENESTVKRVRKINGQWFLCWEDGSGKQEPVNEGEYEVQGEYVGLMRG
jgi:SOS-response transcriptional repressor LexA